MVDVLMPGSQIKLDQIEASYQLLQNLTSEIKAEYINYNALVNPIAIPITIFDKIRQFLSFPIPEIIQKQMLDAFRIAFVSKYNTKNSDILLAFARKYKKASDNFFNLYVGMIKFLDDNQLVVDFKDIALHPAGLRNTTNIDNHKRVLDLLVQLRMTECGLVADINPQNIYTKLNGIAYTDIAADANLYRQIACDVSLIIRQNTEPIMAGKTFDIPIGSKNMQIALKQERIISDTSVEGVVWTVGYDGAIIPFATMKYSKAVIPKSHNMMHELIIGFILNTIRNLTPNFMYVWSGFSCNIPLQGAQIVGAVGAVGVGGSVRYNHDFNTLCENNNPNNLEAIVLAEVISTFGTFNDVLFEPLGSPKHISWTKIVQIIFLVIASLSVAQEKYNFVHGDLHGGNILIKKLLTPVNIKIKLGAHDYTINTEYIPIIIDYGLSRAEYNGILITPLRHAWNGANVYHPIAPENDQFRGDYMPLYDVARLLQNIIINKGAQGLKLDNVLVQGLGIPTISGLNNTYVGDPAVFKTAVANPLRVMAHDLYMSAIDPAGVLV